MAIFGRSNKRQPDPQPRSEGHDLAEVPDAVAEIIATQDFSFFTPDEWERFAAEVRESIARVGVPEARYDGQGYIVAPSVGYIFLDNISRACHAESPTAWGGMLDEFLGSVVAPRSDNGAVSELRVRLVPNQMDDDTVGRAWAPTIIQELCFDYPTAIVGASPDDLERLRVSEDDAFAIAWQQTLASTAPEAGHLFTTDDEPKQILLSYQFGESFFVSSLVQDLPRYADGLGPDGALFGVPSRTGFCIHRLGVDAPLELALSATLQVIQRLFDDAIRQVSREVFWWIDGQVIWLPTTSDEAGLPMLDPAAESVRRFNAHLGR